MKKKIIKEVKKPKLTVMDIVYNLHPKKKRLSFFEWLNRYL